MSLQSRHRKMQQFEPDESGVYRYVGNWQIFRGDARMETKWDAALLSVMAAGILAVGLIPGSANHLWYVMGPYAFSFLTAGISIFYCISFMISHWILMEQEHKRGVGTASFCFLLTAFLMAFTGTGQLVNLFRNRPEGLFLNILIALAAWISFAAAAALRYRSKHLWHFELISDKERQRYLQKQ